MKRLTAPLFTLALCGFSFSSLWAADAFPAVEAFLKLRLQAVNAEQAGEAVEEKILARPDPETFFLRYAYGLQRHAKKLLTGEQTARLNAVMERHKPVQTRWHDERNTLRCKWSEVMWRHAAVSDAEASASRRDLEEWMRLRMIWTQQEHLAQYRFARDVWSVLAPDQQGKIIRGEWKAYAKLDTGHTRGDAAARIIARVLGQPDRPDAFTAASGAWSEERVRLHAEVYKAENRERCIVFAMDLNNEVLAHRAAVAATEAYAKLYLAEAEAVRRLVRAGYAKPEVPCARAAAEAWAEAPKRFTAGASDLMKLLQAK